MPNQGMRNKRGGSRKPLPERGTKAGRVDSVKDLLARLPVGLTRVTQQAARQDTWRNWLQLHLPEDLDARITGVVERDGTLVLFAESAAWCARLRYALQDIEAPLRAAHPSIHAFKVRVLPKS